MTTNDHPTPKNAELYDWDVLQTLKAQQHDSPAALYAYARYALQYGCRTASDDPTTPRNILLRSLDAAESAEEELARLNRENAALRAAARTLHFWSRRYCDGRSTYAPGDHNRATHTLLSLGVTLPPDPLSRSGPFAMDGGLGLTPRELDVLEQMGVGHE